MRLTGRGWGVAGAVPVLYGVGRVLGAVELAMMAAAALALLGAGYVMARIARPVVTARRTFFPHRLQAGSPGRAQIEVVNRGPWYTPVLVAEDAFAQTRRARIALPPISPGGAARAVYRLPTERRGLYTVGPLLVEVTDPLGLFGRAVVEQPVGEVTVYPRVHEVVGLPPTAGHDFVGGGVGRLSRTRASQEFHSLREYAVGDDLRRVHWRSTARLGRLMVREDDVPWQIRATLVLDTARSRYREEAFERAVESAASVLTALDARSALVRYLDTSGTEISFGSGHEHHQTVMEALATVPLTRDDRLDDLIARLRRDAGAGVLVMLLGTLEDESLLRLAALRRRFAAVVAVRHVSPGASPADARPAGPGVVFADAPGGRDFPPVWSAAVAAMGSRLRGKVRPWWREG